MSKIAVVGAADFVLGFRTLGLTTVTAEDAEKVAFEIVRLAQDNYAVIFLDETLAKQIPETLERYKSTPFPAVIAVPGPQGAKGFGLLKIKENVEKAVGVDILFGKDEQS